MNIPVLAISAFSNSGKTTLICKLIPALAARGIRTAVIKHAHHAFDVDTPGKDSFKIRESGASQTLVASAKRWALMTETIDNEELDLNYLLAQLDPELTDLVIVEGFKSWELPRIQLHRKDSGKPFPDITNSTLALVTDDPDQASDIRTIGLDGIEEICLLICEYYKL